MSKIEKYDVLYNYGKPIKWNVGALFCHDIPVLALIDMLNDYDIENPFNSVFGSIPCEFCGGHHPGIDLSLDKAFRIIDAFNERGTGCNLTFSNYTITENDLYDNKSNELLKHINENNINGVIVSSDILTDYIQQEYKNIKIIASIIKPAYEKGYGDNLDVVNYYNDLTKTYDIVVVNEAKVKDDSFIKSLLHPERIEFIANSLCSSNCKFAKKHYDLSQKFMFKKIKGEDTQDIENQILTMFRLCQEHKFNNPFNDIVTLSKKDIKYLLNNGVFNFKIQGRHVNTEYMLRDIGDYVFNFDVFLKMYNNLDYYIDKIWGDI